MRIIKTYLFYALIACGGDSAWGQVPSSSVITNPDKDLVVTFDEIQNGLEKLLKSTPSPDDIRELYKSCMRAPEGENTENWTNYRKLKLQCLLQFYVATGKLLDPKFNPHDTSALASLNAPAPPGTSIIPGQDPSQVKDPKERAAYDKLIVENNKKLAYVALQGTLLNVRDRCLKYTKFYIEGHYEGVEMDEARRAVSEQLGNSPAAQTLLQVK